jgi:hypothetical protein
MRLVLGVREGECVVFTCGLEEVGDDLAPADPLERTNRLAIESDGARQDDRVRRRFEDSDAKAAFGEEQRREGSNGPEAHDSDVMIGLAHVGFPLVLDCFDSIEVRTGGRMKVGRGSENIFEAEIWEVSEHASASAIG